jgi:YD repeat-containing protein
LIGQIDFKQASTVRMTTTKGHDYLNRLASIASHAGGTPSLASLSFAYQYNNANQRTRMTLADGSYWLYEYDSLGQVKSGKRYWADHTPVAGQQNEYAFDDIGNRTTTKAGGDENGANLRSASYTSNSRNQYVSRTVPNTSSAVWMGVSATAGGSPVSGNVFVPQTAESLTYDADGNLTQDGHYEYTLDAENRLITIKTRQGSVGSHLDI